MENNLPIVYTQLSEYNKYDDELFNIIKQKFNKNDIDIFEFNYNIYKMFKNKKNDFLIDLDQIYGFIGFSRKDPAKRLLLNHFEKNKDFQIECSSPPIGGLDEQHHKNGNKEIIKLTIKCFKKFCMKAATKRSETIYDYYITMEEIVNEYIENKITEQNNINMNNLLIIKAKDNEINNINKQLDRIKPTNGIVKDNQIMTILLSYELLNEVQIQLKKEEAPNG